MVSQDQKYVRSKAPFILAGGILLIGICSAVVAVVGYYNTADGLLPAAEPIRHEGLPAGIVAPK